ncbi:hypothetical protein PR048_024883 [Dryococelus australis]|uniref:Reverse transcriptase domain-containing protein n=1 Tax=Dryococelus australis TaxID=614101 RepID=A0ABQ9GPY4_9NEOP|nr:hypothetical protein PR048_024883 [Dryococelus australis]
MILLRQKRFSKQKVKLTGLTDIKSTCWNSCCWLIKPFSPNSPAVIDCMGPKLKLNLDRVSTVNHILFQRRMGKGLQLVCIATLWAVIKKDGSFRLCLDACKLKNITIKSRESLRPADELLRLYQEVRYMSTIDLTHGYWQVTLSEDSKQYTAFLFRNQQFCFEVLPFGICNAVSQFTRCMSVTLGEGCAEFARCYVYDILVTSATFEEHLQQLQAVLNQLTTAGMTVNLKKSLFCPNTDFPLPRNVRQLRAFLGIVSFYRNYSNNIAEVCSLLFELLKKDVTWYWTSEKQAIEATEELFLHTSSYALGAKLAQLNADGVGKMVAMATRMLINAEKIHGYRTRNADNGSPEFNTSKNLTLTRVSNILKRATTSQLTSRIPNEIPGTASKKPNEFHVDIFANILADLTADMLNNKILNMLWDVPAEHPLRNSFCTIYVRPSLKLNGKWWCQKSFRKNLLLAHMSWLAILLLEKLMKPYKYSFIGKECYGQLLLLYMLAVCQKYKHPQENLMEKSKSFSRESARFGIRGSVWPIAAIKSWSYIHICNYGCVYKVYQAICYSIGEFQDGRKQAGIIYQGGRQACIRTPKRERDYADYVCYSAPSGKSGRKRMKVFGNTLRIFCHTAQQVWWDKLPLVVFLFNHTIHESNEVYPLGNPDRPAIADIRPY